MYTMEYNGQFVHAQLGEEFDENKYQSLYEAVGPYFAEEYFDSCLVPILDENDNPIPIDECICGAYNPYECGCATTYWDNYKLSEFDFE